MRPGFLQERRYPFLGHLALALMRREVVVSLILLSTVETLKRRNIALISIRHVGWTRRNVVFVLGRGH